MSLKQSPRTHSDSYNQIHQQEAGIFEKPQIIPRTNAKKFNQFYQQEDEILRL